MSGNAAALRTKLVLTEPALHAATTRLWRAPGLADRYPAYLRLMHGVIRASVPIMERAVDGCAGDRALPALRDYLRAHIEQERDHDAWLLADLAALGHDAADLTRRPPPPVVARLVGAQYFWVEHFHPVALLGYLAVMEGNRPAAWLPDWITATAGVPDRALRTVREHAALDAGHTAAVYDLLDALPLTAEEAGAVAVSALHTVHALIALFAHLGDGS